MREKEKREIEREIKREKRESYREKQRTEGKVMVYIHVFLVTIELIQNKMQFLRILNEKTNKNGTKHFLDS